MIQFGNVETSANKNTRKGGERKTPKRKPTFTGFVYTRNSKGRTGFKASLALWERLGLESNGFFIGLDEGTLYAFMCDQASEFTGKAVYYSTSKSKKENATKSRGILSDKLETQLIAVGVINETSEADIVDGKVFKQYLNLSTEDCSSDFDGLPEEVNDVYEFVSDPFPEEDANEVEANDEIAEAPSESVNESNDNSSDSQDGINYKEEQELEAVADEDGDDDDF